MAIILENGMNAREATRQLHTMGRLMLAVIQEKGPRWWPRYKYCKRIRVEALAALDMACVRSQLYRNIR